LARGLLGVAKETPGTEGVVAKGLGWRGGCRFTVVWLPAGLSVGQQGIGARRRMRRKKARSCTFVKI